MKVIIYVEGPSDRDALNELLAGLLQRLSDAGVAVDFIPTEGKKRLMQGTPVKAFNILRNDPQAIVVALPDLYPPNIGVEHRTYEELKVALITEFQHHASRRGELDVRMVERFQVFCLKHDLEALVLAAEAALASRLGLRVIERTWIRPVENQNHDQPPKRVVEALFRAQGERYKDTIDAPLILGAADYPRVAASCSQCFLPFVEFLESLLVE